MIKLSYYIINNIHSALAAVFFSLHRISKSPKKVRTNRNRYDLMYITLHRVYIGLLHFILSRVITRIIAQNH